MSNYMRYLRAPGDGGSRGADGGGFFRKGGDRQAPCVEGKEKVGTWKSSVGTCKIRSRLDSRTAEDSFASLDSRAADVLKSIQAIESSRCSKACGSAGDSLELEQPWWLDHEGTGECGRSWELLSPTHPSTSDTIRLLKEAINTSDQALQKLHLGLSEEVAAEDAERNWIKERLDFQTAALPVDIADFSNLKGNSAVGKSFTHEDVGADLRERLIRYIEDDTAVNSAGFESESSLLKRFGWVEMGEVSRKSGEELRPIDALKNRRGNLPPRVIGRISKSSVDSEGKCAEIARRTRDQGSIDSGQSDLCALETRAQQCGPVFHDSDHSEPESKSECPVRISSCPPIPASSRNSQRGAAAQAPEKQLKDAGSEVVHSRGGSGGRALTDTDGGARICAPDSSADMARREVDTEVLHQSAATTAKVSKLRSSTSSSPMAAPATAILHCSGAPSSSVHFWPAVIPDLDAWISEAIKNWLEAPTDSPLDASTREDWDCVDGGHIEKLQMVGSVAIGSTDRGFQKPLSLADFWRSDLERSLGLERERLAELDAKIVKARRISDLFQALQPVARICPSKGSVRKENGQSRINFDSVITIDEFEKDDAIKELQRQMYTLESEIRYANLLQRTQSSQSALYPNPHPILERHHQVPFMDEERN